MALPTVNPGDVIASTAWNNIVAAVNAIAAGSGLAMTGGVRTFHPALVAASPTPAAGTMMLTGFVAPGGFTAANVNLHVASGGSGVSLLKVGLFTLDSSGNGTRVALSADQSASVGSTGKRVFPLTASVAITAGQAYAVGILGVGGASRPQYAAAVASQAGVMSLSQPFTSMSLAAQTDIPASFTFASLATTATAHYFEITT